MINYWIHQFSDFELYKIYVFFGNILLYHSFPNCINVLMYYFMVYEFVYFQHGTYCVDHSIMTEINHE